MHNSDRVTFQQQYLQDQKLLMLCWCSFSNDSWDVINSIFAHKGGQYCDYEYEQPDHVLITWLARPELVDALLMLILAQVYPQYAMMSFGIVYR